MLQAFIQEVLHLCKCHLSLNIHLFFSKSSLQREISMIKDSTCESFEPLTALDLPPIPVHAVEPESPPASVTELESSPILANVTIFQGFLRCIQGEKPLQN